MQNTPALQPPPPPAAASPPTASRPAARQPLTLVRWAKASLLGVACFFALGLAFIALGPGFDDYREGDYAVPGYVALVGGTVIGAYALKLRYLKAYFAVAAGVFGLVVIVVAAVSVTGYSS